MNTSEAKRVLETALICAPAPLPLNDMKALFAGEVGNDTLRRMLDELVNDWQDRGVELVALSSGWRFQSRPEMREFLDRLHPEKPPKYSRAAMETLAIVAYRQPVTRGDIEDIRGVTVSSQIVKQLEERGWIDAIGYREAPGRPALYATTRQFLDDLGLASLDQLPAIDGNSDGVRALQALASSNAEPSLLDDGQGSLPLDADSPDVQAQGMPSGADDAAAPAAVQAGAATEPEAGAVTEPDADPEPPAQAAHEDATAGPAAQPAPLAHAPSQAAPAAPESLPGDSLPAPEAASPIPPTDAPA